MRSPSGLSSRTFVPRNWTAESEVVRSRWSTAGELWWRKWGKWRRLRLRRSSLLSLPSERPAWGPDRRDWELWSSRGGNWFSSSEIRPVSPDSRSPGGRHRVQTQSQESGHVEILFQILQQFPPEITGILQVTTSPSSRKGSLRQWDWSEQWILLLLLLMTNDLLHIFL